jgi:ABC-type branched-subunit amino acid transport system substrate-binding protein
MLGKKKAGVLAAAIVVLVSACSSSSKPASSTSATTTAGSSSSGGSTITIGVLTDATGLAASGNQTSIIGARAGGVIAAKDGYKLKFIEADTQSSPTGALTAAQKLVDQDHVNAVIAVSALAFGGASFLTKEGIPVVGAAEDSTEWITSPNMFGVFGDNNSTKVSTTLGLFFKMEGVTNLGSVGYGISPQSAASAKGTALSAQYEGIKVGYLNANFPFGSTNVQPDALAMKSAGVNGFTAPVDPNTGFAFISALRQLGVPPKVALLPTGYGGDLTQAGPGALQSGQGVYFYISFEPVEMHTAATEEFQQALKAVGVTSDPTYAEYEGYASVAMLLQALQTTGANPSNSALISALNGIKSYNALGLLGSHSFVPGAHLSVPGSPGNCVYVTKLSGSSFDLVPGADPICGEPLPNLTA